MQVPVQMKIDLLHATAVGLGLVAHGEEPRIGRYEARRLAKLLLVDVEGRNQEVRVGRTPVVDLVVRDDLVLGLLDLDHLPNSVGLPALPLRITSVSGSNKLTIFPGAWVLPSSIRSRVCCSTCCTRGINRHYA